MNKFQNFSSKKYLFLLTTVCLVFFMLIFKAFDYLPDVQQKNVNAISLQNINSPAKKELGAQNEQNESDTLNNEKQDDEQKLQVLQSNITTEMESIEELPATKISDDKENEVEQALTPEEQAEQILLNVKKLKADKQYTKAIEELHNIPSITTNSNLQAGAYEEIANIYAIVKHYGTALSFAQKAFNLSPSSSREVLLARLYYKTGDIDKATRRINNVLQRDFSQDRG